MINGNGEYQLVSFNLIFTKNLNFDKFGFDANPSGFTIKTAKWFDNMLVTNNISTRIPEQIIKLNKEQITQFRNDLTNTFNAFLAKNQEVIANDKDNGYWVVEDLLNTPYIMDKIESTFKSEFILCKPTQIDVNGFMLNTQNQGNGFIEVYIRVDNEQFLQLNPDVDSSIAKTIWNDKVLYLPKIPIKYL